MRDFEEIYAEYYALVYKYTLSLCRNSSLAEEVAQETFYRALKGIGGFKGQCKMSTWLCRIAKNCYFRMCKRDCGRSGELLPDFPDGTDIETGLIDREEAAGIHRALHGLREPYKEVFWLRTFGELSFGMIAELFEKSESWARVTYYRAKMMIREDMK